MVSLRSGPLSPAAVRCRVHPSPGSRLDLPASVLSSRLPWVRIFPHCGGCFVPSDGFGGDRHRVTACLPMPLMGDVTDSPGGPPRGLRGALRAAHELREPLGSVRSEFGVLSHGVLPCSLRPGRDLESAVWGHNGQRGKNRPNQEEHFVLNEHFFMLNISEAISRHMVASYPETGGLAHPRPWTEHHSPQGLGQDTLLAHTWGRLQGRGPQSVEESHPLGSGDAETTESFLEAGSQGSLTRESLGVWGVPVSPIEGLKTNLQ